MDNGLRSETRTTRVSAPRRCWIGALPWSATVVVAALSIGCSAKSDVNDAVETPLVKVCPAVFGGVVDDDAQAIDAVVEIEIGDSRDPKLCTGALIAPNVVLTARHCVSISPNKELNCHVDGSTDEKAGHVTDDVAPDDIHIAVGALPQASTAFADGAEVYHPDGTNICNRDIAVIVLDRAIDEVKPLSLGAGPTTDTSIRVTGYGKNDIGCAVGTRIRKDPVKVLAIGPGRSSSGIELGSDEFDVQRSFCDGDSGGPAIDESNGNVLGVVSHGRDCSRDGGHVYTSIAGFKDLIDRALQSGAARLAAQDREPH